MRTSCEIRTLPQVSAFFQCKLHPEMRTPQKQGFFLGLRNIDTVLSQEQLFSVQLHPNKWKHFRSVYFCRPVARVSLFHRFSLLFFFKFYLFFMFLLWRNKVVKFSVGDMRVCWIFILTMASFVIITPCLKDDHWWLSDLLLFCNFETSGWNVFHFILFLRACSGCNIIFNFWVVSKFFVHFYDAVAGDEQGKKGL
jgi:hypothetical protein